MNTAWIQSNSVEVKQTERRGKQLAWLCPVSMWDEQIMAEFSIFGGTFPFLDCKKNPTKSEFYSVTGGSVSNFFLAGADFLDSCVPVILPGNRWKLEEVTVSRHETAIVGGCYLWTESSYPFPFASRLYSVCVPIMGLQKKKKKKKKKTARLYSVWQILFWLWRHGLNYFGTTCTSVACACQVSSREKVCQCASHVSAVTPVLNVASWF